MPCRDGDLIERGDDDEKYDFNYDGSELTIKKVEKSDEAEYTCIAENKAGKQDAIIHLKVFGKQGNNRLDIAPSLPTPLPTDWSETPAGHWQLIAINWKQHALPTQQVCLAQTLGVLAELVSASMPALCCVPDKRCRWSL